LINIAGYFASDTGLGVASRNIALAVARKGVNPACTMALAMHGRDRAASPFATPAYGKLDLRFRTTLLISGAVPCDFMFRAASIFQAGGLLAILAYWELTELPPQAIQYLSYADMLFAGSPFTQDVFRRYFPQKPCFVIPCPLQLGRREAPVSRAELGLPEGVPLVLTSFEPLSDPKRKNPEGALKAFLASCAEHEAKLVLKLNWPPDLAPETNATRLLTSARELIESVRDNPRVIVIEESLSYERLIALYSCVDAVLSLHRAEGLGLVIPEAISLRKPVIATGYSGNMAFMEPTYGGLVPYRLVAADGTYGFYNADTYGALPQWAREPQWAEPDVEHASALLVRVLRDPDFAERLRTEGERMALGYQQRAEAVDWLGRLLNFGGPYVFGNFSHVG